MINNPQSVMYWGIRTVWGVDRGGRRAYPAPQLFSFELPFSHEFHNLGADFGKPHYLVGYFKLELMLFSPKWPLRAIVRVVNLGGTEF